jgi:phosphoribosylformimino-5-aminoimidazole carboxamide ribotide isomerase
MQLIPVIDLARGLAVHARAGNRARYGPVESVLTPGVAGDPLELVQAYRDILGARECYVADLDAIEGRAVQQVALRGLAVGADPCGLLVDAGIGHAHAAQAVLGLGAGRVVVGLETLRAFDELPAIVATAGPGRVVFSLDLRLGRPVLHPANLGGNIVPTALEIAERAVRAGVRTLLVLDVGRVGTGRVMDLTLLEELRRRFPSERLLMGGGVGARSDLERLRDVGCDGVLVATALHKGLIGSREVVAPAAPPTAQSIPRASL